MLVLCLVNVLQMSSGCTFAALYSARRRRRRWRSSRMERLRGDSGRRRFKARQVVLVFAHLATRGSLSSCVKVVFSSSAGRVLRRKQQRRVSRTSTSSCNWNYHEGFKAATDVTNVAEDPHLTESSFQRSDKLDLFVCISSVQSPFIGIMVSNDCRGLYQQTDLQYLMASI